MSEAPKRLEPSESAQESAQGSEAARDSPQRPARVISLAEDLLDEAEGFGEPIDLLKRRAATSAQGDER